MLVLSYRQEQVHSKPQILHVLCRVPICKGHPPFYWGLKNISEVIPAGWQGLGVGMMRSA